MAFLGDGFLKSVSASVIGSSVSVDPIESPRFRLEYTSYGYSRDGLVATVTISTQSRKFRPL